MEFLAAPPHGDDQVGGLQQPQVLGDCLAGHVERLAKFAQGLTVIHPQNVQQLSATGIGERLENPVFLHGGIIWNQMVACQAVIFSMRRKTVRPEGLSYIGVEGMENALRSGGGLGVRKFGGAIGAELVGVGDFSLALRAGRMEIAFAAGAEIEAGIDAGGALRAGVGKRLSDEQIDDEADEEVAAGQQKNQQRPQAGIHATALGITIDVTEREKQNREGDGAKGDDGTELKIGKLRVVAERFIAGEDGSVGLKAIMVDREADD